MNRLVCSSIQTMSDRCVVRNNATNNSMDLDCCAPAFPFLCPVEWILGISSFGAGSFCGPAPALVAIGTETQILDVPEKADPLCKGKTNGTASVENPRVS